MLRPLAFCFAGLFATPVHASPEPAPIGTPSLHVPARRVAEATAAEILAGVQAFYGAIDGLSAKFRQEVTYATFGRSERSDGQLFVSKPGKMRWNYFAKKRAGKATGFAKEILSDGQTLYIVDHDNKQVINKDLQTNLLPAAITFLYGKGNLATDFTPTVDTSGTFGTTTDHVLELTPRQPTAHYKRLFLVIDPSNFRVKASIIIDAAGNKNHFRFYEPNFAPKLDVAKVFGVNLTTPALRNYRVVNGNAPAPAAVTPGAPGPAIK